MVSTRKTLATPLRTRLEIFVSYAKEDQQLVLDLVEELKKPFGLSINFFVDTDSIRQGDVWRRKINERLESADILLVVSTGQQRGSHDFPGYEVGFFDRSINDRPGMEGLRRRIIPLIIGGSPPSSVSERQGIDIKQYIESALAESSGETRFIQQITDEDPFRKLLTQLRELWTTLSNANLTANDLKVSNESIAEATIQLYRQIFAHLKGRIREESFPERKLIIRTALPPLPAGEEAVLANSTVEFVGQPFKLLGVPTPSQQLQWPDFLAQINQPEIATQWQEGARSLISLALSEINTDNYYFISSPQAERSFRLFVSLIRTYYSGRKEIHIYIVEVAPTKEYGDAKTTKLIKAIAIGVRYRSLFLENDSEFSPRIVAFVPAKDLRKKVTELWGALQHLLADARQARLDDAALLSFIYGVGGHGGFDELVKLWSEAENDLNKITHDVTSAPDDKAAVMKPDFMKALEHFCDQTEKMNREFTARALQALETEITRKFAGPGNVAVPKVAAE